MRSRAGCAGVDRMRRAQDQEPGHLDLDRAVGEHLLDHLEIGDRAAELAPLARVIGHQAEQAHGLADRARADVGEPDAAERVERELEPAPLRPEQMLRPKPDLVERQLDMARAAQAHHRQVAADREARRLLVDQEQRDAARTGLRVGHRGHHEEVRVQPVADEGLAPATGPSPPRHARRACGSRPHPSPPPAPSGRSSRCARRAPSAAASAPSEPRCRPAGPRRRCRRRAGSGCRWCGRTAPRPGSCRPPRDRRRHTLQGCWWRRGRGGATSRRSRARSRDRAGRAPRPPPRAAPAPP